MVDTVTQRHSSVSEGCIAPAARKTIAESLQLLVPLRVASATEVSYIQGVI